MTKLPETAFPFDFTIERGSNLPDGSTAKQNERFIGIGMTLRDYFATAIDKDEYGDLHYRHLSRDLASKIVGRPCPEEVRQGSRDQILNYQLNKMKWEIELRAAIRFMFADAMMEARKQ